MSYYLFNILFLFIGVDGPMPYAKTLEAAALPQIPDVVHAVQKVLGAK